MGRPTMFLFLLCSLLRHMTLAQAKQHEKILLSKVQTLTLRKDLRTTHRRVSAVPQLKCIGGGACSHYTVDVLRCTNAGAEYSSEDIQWTCTASLPPEFKLGSTDVICEGYDSANDPYVLKGSCGAEYRLVLTDDGERRFGGPAYDNRGSGRGSGGGEAEAGPAVKALFWLLFLGVAAWIARSLWLQYRAGGGAPRATRRPRGPRGPTGGGWGGGGAGDDDDDPPPPYDSFSGSKQSGSTYRASPRSAATQGWTPGFWSGMAGGAAAGYAAGRAGNRTQNQGMNQGGWGWGGGGTGPSSGGGSSFGGSSGSGSYSSTRHESSGFGGTSRR